MNAAKIHLMVSPGESAVSIMHYPFAKHSVMWLQSQFSQCFCLHHVVSYYSALNSHPSQPLCSRDFLSPSYPRAHTGGEDVCCKGRPGVTQRQGLW